MGKRFIYLYGPDGAGKSTQTKLLAKKIKIKKVMIRTQHYPMKALLSVLCVLCPEQLVYPDGTVKIIPRLAVLAKLKKLWVWGQIFSSIQTAFFRQFIPQKMGYTIVAERYFLDTYVDIQYFFKIISSKSSVPKFLLCFVPKTAHFVFLDASYSVLWSRYRERRSVPEPLHYINMQRCAGYQFIRTHNPSIIISTDGSGIVETFNKVFEFIGAGY